MSSFIQKYKYFKTSIMKTTPGLLHKISLKSRVYNFEFLSKDAVFGTWNNDETRMEYLAFLINDLTPAVSPKKTHISQVCNQYFLYSQIQDRVRRVLRQTTVTFFLNRIFNLSKSVIKPTSLFTSSLYQITFYFKIKFAKIFFFHPKCIAMAIIGIFKKYILIRLKFNHQCVLCHLKFLLKFE